MTKKMAIDPRTYDAWYETPRGAWMGATEASALIEIGDLQQGTTLLDAGCGTGWFSRRFAQAGCAVTGIDRDGAMLAYAREHSNGISFVRGDLCALPFSDKSFKVVAAVTSLCFIREQCTALREMARVAQCSILLGLLHRHSLLYWRKHGLGAYRGAHWHTRAEVNSLSRCLSVPVKRIESQAILFWPGGPGFGRVLDTVPLLCRYGAFMAVNIRV